MAKDYEALNAEEWEKDTDASSVRASSPPPADGPATQLPDVPNTDGHVRSPASYQAPAATTIQANTTSNGPSTQQARNGTGRVITPFAPSRTPAVRPNGRGGQPSGRGGQPSGRGGQSSGRGGTRPSGGGEQMTRSMNVQRGGIQARPIQNGFQGGGRSREDVWGPSLPLVKDRTLQICQEKKEEKKLDQKFLRPVPLEGENFEAVLFYRLPEDFDALVLFGDNLEELNYIRQEFQLYVDYKTALRCIRFRSPFHQNMDVILGAVTTLIEVLETLANSSAPKYLVHPPLATKFKQLVVAYTSRVGQGQDTRAVNRPKVAGAPLMDSFKYSDERRPGMIDSNREIYFEHLKRRLNEISALKSWMGMRVHWGIAELTRYPKAMQSPGMNFDKFCSMTKGNGFRGSFEKKMGGSDVAEKFLKHIRENSNIFKDSSDLPEPMFILFVKNQQSNETARVEVRLKRFADQQTQESTYKVGCITCFASAKSKSRLNISTIVMEEKFDMCHEIVTNDRIENHLLGPAMASLIEKLQKATFYYQPDNQGSRYIRCDFLKDHFRPGGGHEALDGHLEVEGVVLRSSWVVGVSGTEYLLEVNLDRKWTGHRTKVEPCATYCGVSLYHPDWVMMLATSQETEQEYDLNSSMTEFFPDGFRDFHSKLHVVSRALNLAVDA